MAIQIVIGHPILLVSSIFGALKQNTKSKEVSYDCVQGKILFRAYSPINSEGWSNRNSEIRINNSYYIELALNYVFKLSQDWIKDYISTNFKLNLLIL